MKLKHFIIAAIIASLPAACTFDKGEIPVPKTPVLADTCSGVAKSWTIEVKDNVFVPDNLTACSGDTIKWVLTQGTHTTTSDSIPAGATNWDQVLTSGGVTTYSVVLTTVGGYRYYCMAHPSSMIGRIVVK